MILVSPTRRVFYVASYTRRDALGACISLEPRDLEHVSSCKKLSI